MFFQAAYSSSVQKNFHLEQQKDVIKATIYVAKMFKDFQACSSHTILVEFFAKLLPSSGDKMFESKLQFDWNREFGKFTKKTYASREKSPCSIFRFEVG